MKLKVWVFSLVLLLSVMADAAITLHIQSPWRDDASKSGFNHYITGNSTGIYWINGDSKPMDSEGDNWFSYTWETLPNTSFSTSFSFAVIKVSVII